jgi:two-component system response regulator NreC
MSRIRILLADDHRLVRAALRTLLESHPDFIVVGEAGDGVEVVEVCRRALPQVVLLDLSMPGRGGIPAAIDLRNTFPEIRLIIVTMHEDEAYVRQAHLAGVSGYVLKSCVVDELVTAIREVAAGRSFFSASLRGALKPLSSSPEQPRRPELQSITEREQEVVALVALGYTTKEVADRLHISYRTVETHRRSIMEKLGFRTRSDLVRFALDQRLICDPPQVTQRASR